MCCVQSGQEHFRQARAVHWVGTLEERRRAIHWREGGSRMWPAHDVVLPVDPHSSSWLVKGRTSGHYYSYVEPA